MNTTHGRGKEGIAYTHTHTHTHTSCVFDETYIQTQTQAQIQTEKHRNATDGTRRVYISCTLERKRAR